MKKKTNSNKGNLYREGGWKCDLNYLKIWLCLALNIISLQIIGDFKKIYKMLMLH